MAVGYRKITLGHVKILIPFSRCATGGGVEGDGAGFASIDMTGKLRAERSSKYSGGRESMSHARRVPDAGDIVTPAESPVKSLKPWRLAESQPIFGRRFDHDSPSCSLALPEP